MAAESRQNVHLYQEILNDDAQSALDEIVQGLKSLDMENREGDEGLQRIKKADLPKFSPQVSKICNSCQINRRYRYGYNIVRYAKAGTVPYHRFTIIVPLEIPTGSQPKLLDADLPMGAGADLTTGAGKDLAVGWATYIRKDAQVTDGLTMLYIFERSGEGE